MVTCPLCGNEKKISKQHTVAGHFERNFVTRICRGCNADLNTFANKTFQALKRGETIPDRVVVGGKENAVQAGILRITEPQTPIPTTKLVGHFLEIQSRTNNFSHKEYPMTVSFDSGTRPRINGGSPDGSINYILVYHPHEGTASE